MSENIFFFPPLGVFPPLMDGGFWAAPVDLVLGELVTSCKGCMLLKGDSACLELLVLGDCDGVRNFGVSGRKLFGVTGAGLSVLVGVLEGVFLADAGNVSAVVAPVAAAAAVVSSVAVTVADAAAVAATAVADLELLDGVTGPDLSKGVGLS